MKALNLKSIFGTVVALCVLTFQVQAAERILATVNGTPIMESQVKRLLAKKQDNEANRQQAVEQIIDDILVQQAIQQSGIKVTNAQLNQVIEGIASQNGLTYGQFLDALEYQGINYNNYRKQLSNQIIMNELRNQVLGQSVEVSREQVEELGQQLFQQAKQQGTEKAITGTEYEVRHILLKLNPLLNDTQAKAQLAQIRADILAKKITFADAAKQYSKDYLSGANGGNLGFAFPEIYSPNFKTAILHSKKGTISAPFKTDHGWHILEVTDTRQGDRTLDVYRQKAYEQLVNSQLKNGGNDWVKVLRRNADIRFLN